MLKFFGAFVAIGAAFSTVSLLVWPVVILACGYTLVTGVIANWAWIFGLAVYAIGLAVIARLIGKSTDAQTAVVIGGPSVVAVVLFAILGMSWSTLFIAACAATFCFAISAILGGVKKLVPYGAVAAIQLVWLAPLATMVYNMSYGDYGVMPVIATLAGAIVAIFASQDY